MGSLKSVKSVENAGQNNDDTIVASTGVCIKISLVRLSFADGVPVVGRVLMLALARLLSAKSLSMTSQLCKLVSPNRSFNNSNACISRSVS